MSESKQCPKCGQIKLRKTGFHKMKKAVDGYQCWCKLCQRKRLQVYYDKNSESVKEYGTEWRRNNKEKDNYLRRKRRARISEKQKCKAISQAQLAVQKGRLVSPQCCELCFADENLEKHHEDYTKPLDVNWLCKKCHSALHKTRRRAV